LEIFYVVMKKSAEKFNNTLDFVNSIIRGGTCSGCGLCVGLDESGKSNMVETPKGPRPLLDSKSKIPNIIFFSCAGYLIDYPKLYKSYYGNYPKSWLIGETKGVYTGYSNNLSIRKNSSSGGIITQVLLYLLNKKKIDGAIVVKQGIPSPEKARVIIANNEEEIISASQSIYIPVSILDILNRLENDKAYAITCLPEQSAAIRILQTLGYSKALQIKYVLGPYTGTALYPQAIETYKKIKGIKKNDETKSLKWRAGEWPGYLEIITGSGKILRSPKVYYNFLIPFFITNSSLQSMDFTNEFADLSVGDAWSPVFEKQGKGFSVVVSRTIEMDSILLEMQEQNLINLNKEEEAVASSMHGHMIDFKKRGGYIRNKLRSFFGLHAPEYGYRPIKIPLSRYLVELVISTVFICGRLRVFRFILFIIPETFLGPLFNMTRLGWKKLSRPVKRKGLRNFNVAFTIHNKNRS